MTELREQLLNLKIDSTQVLRENIDALYLTEHDADQILSLLKEEIKKSLLADEEIREARDKGWEHYNSAANRQDFTEIEKKSLGECEREATAQAQLDKVLKIVEEK